MYVMWSIEEPSSLYSWIPFNCQSLVEIKFLQICILMHNPRALFPCLQSSHKYHSYSMPLQRTSQVGIKRIGPVIRSRTPDLVTRIWYVSRIPIGAIWRTRSGTCNDFQMTAETQGQRNRPKPSLANSVFLSNEQQVRYYWLRPAQRTQRRLPDQLWALIAWHLYLLPWAPPPPPPKNIK